MNRFRQIQIWLARLFRKREFDAEMDEEMRTHIEIRCQQKVNAGMEPEEARFAALRQFGWAETVKESCRDQRGMGWLEDLVQDVRYGARQLRKNPGFTVIAVLTLALGIGANTAIFSALNAVMLRRLPSKDSEQLVWIFAKSDHLGYRRLPPNWANERFSEVMERSGSYSRWARLKGKGFIVQKSVGTEQVAGMRVSWDLFETLGVRPILGRTFLPEENELGLHRVVVLTYECWQRRFGGDPGILNRSLQMFDTEISDRTGKPHDTLKAQSYAVVGVLPPGWQFPIGATPEYAGFFSKGAEIWEPESLTAEEKRGHAVLDLILARLKPQVAWEAASKEANRLLQQLRKDSEPVDGIELLPLRRQVAGSARSALPLLLGATGLLLVLACLNVANLLLARGSLRRKEFAVRAALGAAQFRIIRQLLTESSLLALLGCGSGLVVALWGIKTIAFLGGTSLPLSNEIGLDGTVLAFAVVLSLAGGLIFGMGLAWQTAKAEVSDSLKEATGGWSARWPRQHLRQFLVSSELALSLVLLTGAGLLLNSFVRLTRVDTGYQPERVITVPLSFVHPKYSAQGAGAFIEQLLARVRTLPGVQYAAVASWIPVGGGRDRFAAGFQLEGRSNPEVAQMSFVTAGYFQAMRIPILQGRDFTTQDLAPNAPSAKIVSESFARRYYPNGNAVGRRFIGGVGGAGEIVGVAKDTLESALDAGAEPHIYHASMPYRMGVLVVRITAGAGDLSGAIRSHILALDGDQPAVAIATMGQILMDSLAERRFQTFLLGSFSALALLLAVIGLYGLIAYAVNQSTREIGIRMALGAQQRDVLRLVLRQGGKLVLAGTGLGTISALGTSQVLSSQLFGVTANDPATFATVAALLMAVALVACYVPARRAAKVDPMEALRYE